MKQFIAIILLSIFVFQSSAQSAANNDSFVSPVNPPFSFSGGFGELRNNHFHTGLDFRTGGQIGKPVFAVKDGFISRVNVSPTGYGNAVYMNHPDGTTSVYGHLNRFHPKIEAVVKDDQYYNESFIVDLYLSKNQIRFKKGEIIAWSGNSGSSGGPHLHFEIRETDTERPQNPLFYNLGIKDNSAPKITSLFVYPMSDDSHVNKSFSKKRFETVMQPNGYQLKNNIPVEVFGQIGLGIQAEDYFNGTGMKCGIYSVELKLDNKPEFAFKLKELSFDLNRYINSHIDFDEKVRNNRWVHRLFKQPGNHLDIYESGANKGILSIDDGKIHEVEIIVSDAFNNLTKLKFKLTSKPFGQKPVKQNYTKDFKYNDQNVFENDQLRINIPDGALYDDSKFKYGKSPKTTGLYSEIHEIQDKYTPLHKSFSISIKSEGLTGKLKDKALIVEIDKGTGKRSSLGGNFSNGWVFTQTRIFGNFAVTVDTIAPAINPLSIKEKKILTNNAKIQFTIADNLSGIKSYRGEIDGKWALFEYDAKSKMLSYTFDKTKMEFNKSHQLVLVVEDNKANRAEYKATFHK
jgi:hypothetical protein